MDPGEVTSERELPPPPGAPAGAAVAAQRFRLPCAPPGLSGCSPLIPLSWEIHGIRVQIRALYPEGLEGRAAAERSANPGLIHRQKGVGLGKSLPRGG